MDAVALAHGYAVLTGAGIDLLDETLATRATIAGTSNQKLRVLRGEQRFVVHGNAGSWLYEGRVGGALAQVTELDGLVYTVVPTETGYLAIGAERMLVDHDGAKTVIELPERVDRGCAWRGGAALGGANVVIVDAEGAVVARSEGVAAARPPVALADTLAVATRDDIAILDGEARVIARIPKQPEADGLVAYGDGVLVHVEGDEASEVSYWERGEERWSCTGARVYVLAAIGEHVVVGFHDKDAWILDRGGQTVAKLSTPSYVVEVAAFAGGIALVVDGTPDVLWWRPGEDLARLGHDVSPSRVRAVPAGLLSAERNVVYLWRTDVQGPEATAVSTMLPTNTPIVVDDEPVRIVSAGRFVLRGESLLGHGARSIEPNAAWRPLVSRDDATRIIERLVQRAFDAPKLAGPLGDAADLHGRALFAASTLAPEQRAESGRSRTAFFAELGLALGVSGRVLLAAVKSRRMTLVPPRPVPGFEYLGTFTTSGDLTVSDPAYAGRKASAAGISLSLKLAGHEGVWHVFARNAGARTAELVAIHDDGFDVYATDIAGTIGVDSGTAGVFDKKCPKRDPDAPVEEGTFAALGALAHTGYGDGAYPVFVGRLKGRVAKVRIGFIGDDPEVDRSVAKAKEAAKPYSASAKFALGDTVEHVKFGTGSVIRVGGDGKIDVRFPDGTRTLVHSKK